MSRVIAVFGATGQQGGSVLRALLSGQGGYQIKAITRSAKSEKAKKLAALPNVTVVEADLDNKESVDNALRECYGAFLVTDFTAHFVKDREIEQGVNFIDKAIKNKLTHVVFSGLENVENQLNKPCLHFDYKAAVEDYGLKQAENIGFTSIRMPMFYQEMSGSMLYKTSDKSFLFSLPMDGDKLVYAMDVDQIGECVATIFAQPEQYRGKVLGVAGDYLPASEYAAVLGKHLGPAIDVTFPGGAANRSAFNHMKFRGIEDIRAMFEYYELQVMKRDLELTKKLNPGVLTFDSWVEKNKQKIIASKTKAH